MSMLDGVSQCWALGATCSLNWDALSSVGTMLGVLTALFGPAIRRHFVRKRVSAIFAVAYSRAIARAGVALANFRKEFPLQEQRNGVFWAREQLQSDASVRKRVQQYTKELDELCGAEIDLSKYPDVDTRLAADVSRAILFTADARLCIAALGHDGEADDEVWGGFWDHFVTVLDRAEQTVVNANNQCKMALARMSIENSWR